MTDDVHPYRTEPDALFADRLERDLLRRLASPSDSTDQDLPEDVQRARPVDPDRPPAAGEIYAEAAPPRSHTGRWLAAAAVVLVVAAVALFPIVGDDDGEHTRVDVIPATTEDLGIFAPAAGRVVYVNEGIDGGYDPGLWAVDPSGPYDTTEGPMVDDDVVSTLVRLDLEDAVPLGWSSDGTALLFKRSDGDSLFPHEYLYILHGDGSETQLNRDSMYFGGATISPDGTRVVFAAQGDHLGLYVVDTEGGRPVRLPLPGAEGIVGAPTFSPDGTQIAYVDTGDENHVWVMNADGSDGHEILANEPTLVGVPGNLQWSPAGDRIAIQVRSPDPDGTNAIYTVGPDGSDFARVITAAASPYWSPDGSQIAYTVICDERPDGCEPVGDAGGLGIADADGSNVREFGFAALGTVASGRLKETLGCHRTGVCGLSVV